METGEIDRYLRQQQIFGLFCRQLEKDFEGAGVSTATLSGIASAPSLVRDRLTEAVRQMEPDGDALQRLLYRVDVSEKQLLTYTRKYPAMAFTDIVTELIIMRTLQKVILKKKFSDG